MDGDNQGDFFDVTVPEEALVPPAYEPIPAGLYATTLQPGAEKVANATGWEGVRLPFSGFRNIKSGQEFARDLRTQFTTAHATSAEAVRIGREGLMGAAAAVGLTESVTGPDGKPARKFAASSMDELVSMFNSAAGTQVTVYVTVRKRERNGQLVLKDDGSPFLDNEIRRVSALEE